MKSIFIDTEFITMSQFLKLADLIQSGGQAKFFLKENNLLVNDQYEERRGKKLFINDIIKIENVGEYQIKHN